MTSSCYQDETPTFGDLRSNQVIETLKKIDCDASFWHYHRPTNRYNDRVWYIKSMKMHTGQ
jgi:hypothetical protein